MAPDEYNIITVGADPDRFAELAADHAKWKAVASHLFGAAELLWPAIDAGFRASAVAEGTAAGDGLRYRGPFYLLAGLAVENFAKAILIQRKQLRNEPITNGDFFRLGGSDHDLVRLAHEAGLDLSEGEESLLLELSRFVRWRGRYPVPKRKPDVREDTITGTTDLRRLKAFFARLAQQYQNGIVASR